MDNPINIISETGCSSFELKKSSRGYSWAIKVYDTDVQKCYDIAKQIDQQASKDFKKAILENSKE
jgi:hypothetical protein